MIESNMIGQRVRLDLGMVDKTSAELIGMRSNINRIWKFLGAYGEVRGVTLHEGHYRFLIMLDAYGELVEADSQNVSIPRSGVTR